MRITRIEVKGFGLFHQRCFLPGPGLNLFHGPNESGKSTLLAFLQAMLYGLRGGRRTREGELSPLKRHEPWQGGSYQGVLAYELADGEAYRIGRNFAKGTARLHDAHHNDITARFPLDRETGPLFAQAQLGMDAETFSRTLLVRQMRTVLESGARKTLMDRLIRLQEAGRDELGFRHAEEAIQQALLERVGSARSTVRPLDRILERMAQLEQEAVSIRTQREACRMLMVQLMEERTRVERLDVRQSSLLRERTECRDALLAGERLEQQQREAAARDRLRALENRQAALEREGAVLRGRMSENRPLASLEEAEVAALPFEMGRLRELRRAQTRLEGERSRRQALCDSLETELPEAPVWQDEKRVNEVLHRYLDLREQVGFSAERNEIAAAMGASAARPGWRTGLSAFMLPAGLSGLLAGISAQTGWLGRLDWLSSIPASWGAGLAGTGAVLLVGGLLFLLWPRYSDQARHMRSALLAKQAVKAGGRERQPDILHWNVARRAFEALMAEAGVPSVQAFMRQKDSVDTVKRRMESLREESQALEGQIRDAREETLRLQNHVEGVFSRAGLPDTLADPERLERLQAALAQIQADRARLAENGMRLEALSSERASLERLLAPSENDVGVSFGNVEAVREQAAKARVRLPALQEELDLAAEELSKARMTLATLETRLERVPQEERLQQVLEETDRLVIRKNALQQYGEALRLALEELRAAAGEIAQGVSPRLDEYAGEALHQLTGGRYSRIGSDDRLAVHVEVPQSADMPSVSQLSGGTSDQVWLAVRLAAVRMIERGGETLPLFLDEPFAQYDEARTRSALEWLREQARERQIFLFTCRERDRQLAQEIFGGEEYVVHPLGPMEPVTTGVI